MTTTAGCADAPARSVGSFVPSRSGRALSAVLWLVFALVDVWGPPTGEITRTSVTKRPIRTGLVVPRIRPIVTTPAEFAEEAAAKLVKALVNALHAVRREAAYRNLRLVVSMTPTFPGTLPAQRTPQPRSKAHQPHRSGARPSNGPRMTRGAGSGPQHDQNRCSGRETVNPRSTRPA